MSGVVGDGLGDLPGRLRTKSELVEAIRRVQSLLTEPELVEFRRLMLSVYPPSDMLAWGRRYLPLYFTRPASRLHRELADVLWGMHQTDEAGQRGLGQRLAIVAPRGSGKTVIDSKLDPLFAICHDLEQYILIVGNSTENAQENLQAIRRELEENAELSADYPWACGVGPVWNVDSITTRNGVRVHAVGMGKKLRGRSHGAYRPTHVIIDDLEDDESVMSPQQREKTLAWFRRALMPIGDARTNFIFVGTALHREDTLQTLKSTPGWDFREYRALMREPEQQALWETWRRLYCDFGVSVQERERNAQLFYELHEGELLEGADVLWPENESLLDLMKLRVRDGEGAFQAEKQGQPFTADLCEWPTEYFGDHIWFDEWPELRWRVLALDPSKGKSDKTDYSAFTLLGQGVDGILYVEADISRRDVSAVVTDGMAHSRRFQPHAFAVEINQMQELFQVLFEERARSAGVVLPMVGIHNHVPKLSRIRSLGPYLQAGKLRFKRRSEGVNRLLGQLRDFPLGPHDDGPDSLEMALRTLLHLSAEGVSGADDAGEVEQVFV